MTTEPMLHVIRGGGNCLVLADNPLGLPEVVHWGSDLIDEEARSLVALTGMPVPHNALDEPWPLTVAPNPSDGWRGTPAYAVHRAGGSTTPRWVAEVARTAQSAADAPGGSAIETLTTRATADNSGLELVVTQTLDEHGVLVVRAALTNSRDDAAPVDVDSLRAVLPLPSRATEVLDLGGRWVRERSPQRSELREGTWVRAGRRGRAGHDATLLMLCGTTGFGFRTGEVWGAHTAWSGNHETYAERLAEGAGRHAAVLGGGEVLAPGEIRLGPGETYEAPSVFFVHSTEGMDGVTRGLLAHQRQHPGYRRTPRPVTLNTWEAVYFDTDLDHLKELADLAAELGVERFVLDDGWFGSRRNDTRGLGDWTVSTEVWPAGLAPLVDHVKGKGLQFGLWFEPEMVNPDSDLVRAQPDWVLAPQAGHPRGSRHQQGLDLTHPGAFAHLLESISALVSEYAIDYLKWDHNRDLIEAVASDVEAVDRPRVHDQTAAAYRLFDALRERHPDLEIESCASGGGRVDLEILARTDRVWTSDCNDALERVDIQQWTGLLVPPERMGTHVGPALSHTTLRTVGLDFRLLVALTGHAGLEWDITEADDAERAAIARWIALHKELRPLLHSGRVVRADLPDDRLRVSGVVAEDGSEAVFTVLQTASAPWASPGSVPLPGLDPDRTYRIRVRDEIGLPRFVQKVPPAWWEAALGEGVLATGRALAVVGLAAPVLSPAQGFVLHLTTA